MRWDRARRLCRCGERKPSGRPASKRGVPLPGVGGRGGPGPATGAEVRVGAAVRHRKEGRRPEVPSPRAAALTDLITRKEASYVAERADSSPN